MSAVAPPPPPPLPLQVIPPPLFPTAQPKRTLRCGAWPPGAKRMKSGKTSTRNKHKTQGQAERKTSPCSRLSLVHARRHSSHPPPTSPRSPSGARPGLCCRRPLAVALPAWRLPTHGGPAPSLLFVVREGRCRPRHASSSRPQTRQEGRGGGKGGGSRMLRRASCAGGFRTVAGVRRAEAGMERG